MKKHYTRIIVLILCTILCTGGLTGCADNSDSGNGDVAAGSLLEKVLGEKPIEAPDTSSATTIKLSDKSAVVKGSGAEVDNTTVTITEGGTYVLSGKITDGRIIVNAPDKNVSLVLENADISCSWGSPVYIYKSDTTLIYLADGTQNTLTDGSEYTFSDNFSSSENEEPNACLYSKSDLEIAGKGQLTVNANYNNGITGKDSLKIEESSVIVTAANHGINGKDRCVVKNADIEVTAAGDALRSTNDSDSTLGYIVAVDSDLSLISGEDGIQAETTLAISGGTCTVSSGGGTDGGVSYDISAKGLKAAAEVLLYDGVYDLDCYDDAIHSNGKVMISGGTYNIATSDDGIHADENTAISGGTVTIRESYEGVEGSSVDISGGKIDITADDDGINAAGGADQSGAGPRNDSFESSADCYINISGGIITVDASGDGVDSNGGLMVSGGELYISGPESSGNGALDYGGEAIITGGIVVAAGAGGMAQNFGTDSTQGSILMSYPAFSDGTITLKDETGKTLASYSPKKSYSCVVISCPDITTGNTYTVEACGQTSSVTMSSLIYGNSGSMGGPGAMGGPGNMGGPGGMGKPGGRP